MITAEPDEAPAERATRAKRTRRPHGHDTPSIQRALPSNLEAEQGILSSILLDPTRGFDACEDRQLTADWFTHPAHRTIYIFLQAIWHAKIPLDFITLSEHLRQQEKLEEVGGAAFVTSLFTYLPTAANASYYVDILAEKFAARQLIHTCTQLAARAYTEQDRIGELIDEAQAAILAINRPDATGMESIQHVRPAVFEAVKAIEETYAHRGGVVGLPTGFFALDRMTGGMRGPLLIVPAGRPSMGKSAFVWNIGEHVAMNCGRKVLGFSLEMNTVELVTRMVCGRAEVNLQRVRDGFLSQVQMEQKLPGAATTVASAPIYIDDTPGLSIQELRTRVRRFVHQHPDTAIIIIDYLQLLRSTSRRAQENRALEIAEISGGLKRLAKEINRPILAPAQLNRDNDGANAKPKLSNLRESGSIEQDADWVILLHRKHYYTKADEDKGKADVDLAKQRNGPTKAVVLEFDHELGRFKNPPEEAMYSNDPEKRQQSSPRRRGDAEEE